MGVDWLCTHRLCGVICLKKKRLKKEGFPFFKCVARYLSTRFLACFGGARRWGRCDPKKKKNLKNRLFGCLLSTILILKHLYTLFPSSNLDFSKNVIFADF